MLNRPSKVFSVRQFFSIISIELSEKINQAIQISAFHNTRVKFVKAIKVHGPGFPLIPKLQVLPRSIFILNVFGS